jgi:hypothetical protein
MPLFRRRPKRVAEGEQRFGLVVGPLARIIYDDNGRVIFDELSVQEAQDRKRGREIITFDEGEDD